MKSKIILISVILQAGFGIPQGIANEGSPAPPLHAGVAALRITPVDDQGNLWQEPFTDRNHNGRYDPSQGWRFWRRSDPYRDTNENGKWDGPFLAGFKHKEDYYVAQGIHDPIWARALVLSLGKIRIAFVALDLVGLLHDEVERIREDVLDLELDYVLIASTHTHSAPDSMGLWGPDPFTDGKDPRFMEHIRRQTAKAIRKAEHTAVPAKLTFIETRVPDNFGAPIHDKRDPIVIDNRLLALRAADLSGQTIAILINGAAHPETLGGAHGLISSDFPHFLRIALEKGDYVVQGETLEGWGGTAVYFSGAVGGLMTTLGSKVRNESGEILPQRSFEKTQRIGELMAWAVSKSLRNAEPVEITEIGVLSRRLMITVDNRLLRYLLKKDVIERTTFTQGQPAGKKGEDIETEVGLVSFYHGDQPVAQFAAIPGELFPEINQGGYLVNDAPCWTVTDRKKIMDGKGRERTAPAHPHIPAEPVLQTYYKTPFTFLFGLANDELGYIVPSNDFVPPRYFPRPRYGVDRCGDSDHYEETRSASSWLAPVISETIIQMLIQSGHRSRSTH